MYIGYICNFASFFLIKIIIKINVNLNDVNNPIKITKIKFFNIKVKIKDNEMSTTNLDKAFNLSSLRILNSVDKKVLKPYDKKIDVLK